MATERGFSFLSILAALLIVGLLYLGWVSFMPLSKGNGVARKVSREASRETACAMNRAAVEKVILTWSIAHPGATPTIEDLKKERLLAVECPDGGRFSISAGKVVCSLHRQGG